MVLVVDNHPDTREALVRLLRMKGHQATAVSDAAQLLALLRAGALPTLIVLDVNVPRRDGMGLLRTLRTDPRLTGVPVLVFSTDDRPRDEALRLACVGPWSRAHSAGNSSPPRSAASPPHRTCGAPGLAPD